MDRLAIRSSVMDFLIIGGAVLVACAVLSFAIPETGMRVAALFLINLSAVLSIVVFMGFSGVMTFGHIGFMSLGAYFGAYLTLPTVMKAQFLPGLPDWLIAVDLPVIAAVPIVMLVVGLVAVVIGLSVCRLPVDTAPIATIGILVIIHGVLIGARDLTRGIQPLFGFGALDGLWLPLGFALFTVAVALVFRVTPTGLKLQASRDNELSAAASGVAVFRVRLVGWTLSAMLIAGSGLLLAHYLTVISPRQFYFVQMFALLAMAIVGGVSTVTGAVVGTGLVTALSELTRRIEGAPWLEAAGLPPLFGLSQLVLAGAILFIMYRRPSGLIAWREPSSRLFARLPAPTSANASAASVQPAASVTASGTQPALELRGLSKSFAGVKALSDVSFALKRGETLSLIGPNGSGKTTLVNLVTGVIRPDAGAVYLNGEAITGDVPHLVARRGIARTFQNIRLFETMSVADNVRLAALDVADDPRSRAFELLAELGLSDVAQTPAGELSYGRRRRVEIARAVALAPSVLLLDEPTAGMNETESADLADIITRLKARFGLSLLVIEHDQAFVRNLSDRVLVLNQGELIAGGTADEVRRNSQVIEAYLGRGAASDLNTVYGQEETENPKQKTTTERN
ncbi:ATP-binding cassette domain-containing protein [Hoeflea prorocentri]|uniref:Branched-chain amino acid ABC transporter ATP-binding protein/permease n=1 Tax=Hoeflea prorocentri TaxID=1922333 RepID=A0A9X3ZHX5_9HYPH|nr:branched-chain amino acid ABC transporter ATP-binding protein/permease [Hoeflea prorocentri]MCY6381809.1 branched-chain amino acid ABC transporter ATP-binding protein/permease [Hoeflea prorocentri]MDA5399609.1 branched-chain amino acid ABC transporter ATP-binding protein/permease [Hoeflea prorocentri]